MVIDNNKFEDLIEYAYWEFNALMKNKEFRFYSERDKFKMALRAAYYKEDDYEDGL